MRRVFPRARPKPQAGVPRPDRARCPYCATIVTGQHIGPTVYGWGCRDEDRCTQKAEKAGHLRLRLAGEAPNAFGGEAPEWTT